VANDVNGVVAESGDETIQHDPDLGIAQSRLLVAGDPERRALSERHLFRRPPSLSAQEALLFERDDVRERRCLIAEVPANAFRSRRRRGNCDHERGSGLRDLDDFDAAHVWSLLVAASGAKSMFLCSFSFFRVST
jgi:hypothetical protein